MLVVIAVVATLFGILLPMLSGSIERARMFKCQMSQRTVAFDFQIFADDQLHGDRGEDSGRSTFRIETFQESQYGVDEFWRWGGDQQTHETPDSNGNDPMRCPSVRDPVTLRNNVACSSGAVGPPQNISFGFNSRLDRAEIVDSHGRPRAVKARLHPSVVQESNVPLLIDVDGQRAFMIGANPIYTAPSLDSFGPYAGDRVWFPGLRHNGQANAAFMDGHVASSSTPDEEAGWRWDYQPIR
ncbi:MAG: prepilin-type N-terminal cleavage/methylation domain-containing protein [Phycisphaerales bacterium]|nr:prepilin-type N-terminal cleavage/methylation domain-containing protein [Phycisphaerales bacterium]